MEKRYFLVGHIFSKAGSALEAGHAILSSNSYPSRKALESSLLEERPGYTVSIVSICEQTKEDQEAFLSE